MRLSTSIFGALCSFATLSPAIANELAPEDDFHVQEIEIEPQDYAQRGIVLAPQTFRLALNGKFSDRTIRSSYLVNGVKEETQLSSNLIRGGAELAYSPIKNLEFGLDILNFIDNDHSSNDFDFISGIWGRLRFIESDDFEMGVGLKWRSHLILELPMRYYLSPCTHVAFTPAYWAPLKSEDGNHLLTQDRSRLHLYLGVVHNFIPALYGGLAFDTLFDLTHSDHRWGGSAALGYSFQNHDAAFIDLELNYKLTYLSDDTVNGLDSITWHTLGLSARLHL